MASKNKTKQKWINKKKPETDKYREHADSCRRGNNIGMTLKKKKYMKQKLTETRRKQKVQQ